MSYYTTSGPKSGPIRWHETYSLGVYEDDRLMSPVGFANPVTWDGQGRTLFTLIVRGTELPGRFIVVDRCFIPAEEQGEAHNPS
jgi:hypothetical protein